MAVRSPTILRRCSSSSPTATLRSESAGRLYGQVAVGQLERLGESVFDIAAAYARHFRITGKTCSLLMLESEADYQRFNINPQEDDLVVRLKKADKTVEAALANKATSAANAKQQMVAILSSEN